MPEIDETVRKIKDLEIQGAQSIAKESLKALKELAQEKGFGDEFDQAAGKLVNARPTGVSAYNCVQYVKEREEIQAIDEVLDYLENAREEAAENAAELIQDDSILLTHCHSSTVMEALKTAKEDGKDFRVIVTETEPKLQGLRTARKLVQMDVPVYYIVDSAAGLFMWAADLVLVGADSIKAPGVLNKVGTYPISLAAKEDPEVEFYFVATQDKLDYDNFSTIEERPPEEIREHEKLEDPDAVLENPAFDLTPWDHFDGLMTEDGLLERDEFTKALDRGFKI